MIWYLTYNDLPSGIYSSQVIDVVKFISREFDRDIRLIAFISLRGFTRNRRKLKQECPDAIVMPMVPGLKRWKWNAILLKILFWKCRPSLVIGRSVLATLLAQMVSSGNFIYDGRGAIAAEWSEYDVVQDPYLLANIGYWERKVIHEASYRIAVSERLVQHWQHRYAYSGNAHVIIPCTLNEAFTRLDFSEKLIHTTRREMGFQEKDIVYVYSGSVAGWQSFNLLQEFMLPVLQSGKHCKLLFLGAKASQLQSIADQFPEQVFFRHARPNEVPYLLIGADYGLLIREQSVTNEVASPVKFAEYLSCGLEVLLSDKLGDYSEFVRNNMCGYIIPGAYPVVAPDFDKKQSARQLALRHFTKESQRLNYQAILQR